MSCILHIGIFRLLFVLIPGSRSSASNNSKKSSSSSSGKKPTLSSSSQKSQKMPSGNSKKRMTRDKAKEQMLRHYGWLYVGILFALMVGPLLLRNHLILQCMYVSSVWAGLYWFCTVVDCLIVSSYKWILFLCVKENLVTGEIFVLVLCYYSSYMSILL